MAIEAAVFTLYYLPGEGGAKTRLNSFIRGNNEVKFTIYTPRKREKAGKGPVFSEQEAQDNVDIRFVPVDWKRGLAAATYALNCSLIRILQKRTYDICYSSSPPVTTVLPTGRLLGSKTPLVLDIGDPWVSTLLIGGFIKRKRTGDAIRKVEDYCISKADYVTTASPFISEMFRGLNPSIETIYTSFDLASRRGKDLGANKDKIIYVGHLGPLYLIEPAIIAMASLVETHGSLEMEIIGQGPGEKKLRSLVDEKGLRKRIRFSGQLSNDAVRERLADAWFSLIPISNHPLHQYTVPTKLLESLAHGIPVIGWGSRGVKYIIGESQAGLYIDEPEPKRIAEAISEVLDNVAARERFAANAVSFASRELDISKNQSRLNEIYRRLIKG